jgi:hypothetical protein
MPDGINNYEDGSGADVAMPSNIFGNCRPHIKRSSATFAKRNKVFVRNLRQVEGPQTMAPGAVIGGEFRQRMAALTGRK